MMSGCGPLRYAVGGVAVLIAATDASAQARMTKPECKAVAVAMGQVFEALPRDSLSLPFRQSATSFVKVGIDCPVAHRIEVATDIDARALDDVLAMLRAQTPPVELRSALQIVDLRTPPSAPKAD